MGNFSNLSETLLCDVFSTFQWKVFTSWHIRIFLWQLGRSRGSNCVCVPNFVEIAQTAAEIWRFLDFFKMAAVRHLGFSEVGNFNFRSRTEAQYASSCQISRRSVVDFRFFKMSSAGILDVENFKFLTVGTLKRAELCLRAKFCRNRSNRGWHICMSYKKLK